MALELKAKDDVSEETEDEADKKTADVTPKTPDELDILARAEAFLGSTSS